MLEFDPNDADKQKTIYSEGQVLIGQIMKSIEEESKKAEKRDYLTGLYGRKEGERLITEAMYENSGCFAFVDLDNLKRTNDTMGHLAGDYALKTVGEVLAEAVENAKEAGNGEKVIAARLGGDEFLLYMTNVDKEQATRIIEKILKTFNEKCHNVTFLSVSSLSIGLCMTRPMDSFGKIFKKADQALYHVKQSGKCGYFFYKEETETAESQNSIDLQKLVENLKNQGGYDGALSVEYREFAKIYDFVRHLGTRYAYDLHLVMITVENSRRNPMFLEEREQAMSCMEQTIRLSLRAVDVCTRFSSDQFIVILTNAHDMDVSLITERIEKNFYKIYKHEMINVYFDVANLAELRKKE